MKMLSVTILLWITTISKFCDVTTSIIPFELISNKYKQISSIPKKNIRSSNINILENDDDNETMKKLSTRAIWESSFKLLLPVNGKKSREGMAQENNKFYSSILAKYLDLEERVLADNENTNWDDIYNKTSGTVGDVKDTINTAPISWDKSQWIIIGAIVGTALVAFGCLYRCIPCAPRIV